MNTLSHSGHRPQQNNCLPLSHPLKQRRRRRDMYINAAMSTALLHLLLSFSLFSIAVPPASPPLPPSPAPTNCSDELVTFSMCLPYISSYPNNLTRLPSSQCCHDVASAVTSRTVVCFCYLVRNPLMLGFPLNFSRLLSLTTLCRVKDPRNDTRFSLDSLCSGSPILPPLLSITGPDGRSKQNSGPGNPPPPSTGETNDSEAIMPAPAPGPIPAPADDYFDFESQHASAANRGAQPSLSATVAASISKWRGFLAQIMILALHLCTYL